MEIQEDISLTIKKREYVVDYLRKRSSRLAIALWEEEKDFPFLCLDHLKMSKALGFPIEQVTSVLQQVKENCLKDEKQLDEIIQTGYFDYTVFEDEIHELHVIQKESTTSVGGGTFGPLTVASGIFGIENLMRYVKRKPEFVKRFVGYITNFLVELAKQEKEEGADFFWIAEPLASVVSPNNFWEFSGKYLKQIFEAFQGPGCLHVCGPTFKHTQAMVDTGAEVLSIDSMTDVKACLQIVPKHVVILGNISPIDLQLESKEYIYKKCIDLLEEVEGYDNFILSTGCNVIDGTPKENVAQLYKAVEDFGSFS